MTRLTQLVKRGGCAAKVPATVLREILNGVEFPVPRSEVIVDGSTFDDAAIVSVPADRVLVQTLDFFTPIVDSPESFGRIAAANALSDVYAMGGVPLACMAILTFPSATLEHDIVRRILQAAVNVISESGASLVGGHSVDDDTLKFGLSVTGTVERDLVWSNAGARVGDSLILTKPLGTGTLTAALKSGAITEAEMHDALDSMGRLNRVPELLDRPLRATVHAATDITGFGLAGHTMQLAAASAVSLCIDAKRLPAFVGVRESLARGTLTRAHTTNRAYTASHVSTEGVSAEDALLVVDPQTSGGLLLAVDASATSEILDALRRDFSAAAVIGTVNSRGAFGVVFE